MAPHHSNISARVPLTQTPARQSGASDCVTGQGLENPCYSDLNSLGFRGRLRQAGESRGQEEEPAG